MHYELESASQLRQRDFSLFTFYFSLFTKQLNNQTTKPPDHKTTNYRFIIFLPFTI